MAGSRVRGCRTATAVVVVAVVAALLASVGPTAAAAGAVPVSTGTNASGQLGDPSVATRRTSPGPVGVPGAVAIASGRDHAYALDAEGRLWGWGENSNGQVGDGTTTDRRTPVRLALTDVVAIEAGHYHGIALRADGTVWTWGYGALGQLGIGSTVDRTTPVQVPGLSGITQVAAGRDMTYVVRADGTALGWGNNSFGEVGEGTTVRRTTPVPVVGLTQVVEISGGRNHGLARRADGSLWAWGDNQYGQVGDGTTTRRTTPVPVVPSGVAHLDAGAHHSIAVRTDGVVLTWGRGYRGQLGLGSTAGRTSPTVVPGLPASVEVGDGRDQSFAIDTQGRVWAWGQNADGQLGDGTTTTRTSPVLLSLSGIVAVQSGSAHSVFLPRSATEPTTTTTTSTTTTTTTSTTTTSSTTTSTTTTTSSTTTTTTVPPIGSIEFRAGVARSVNSAAPSIPVPATVQPGDQLLLFVALNADRAVATPSGWTSVASTLHPASSDLLVRVFRRTATPSDPGSIVGIPLPVLTKVDLSLVAYAGADPADPIAGIGSLSESTVTAVHRAPDLTSVPAASWVLSYWVEKTSTTTDWVPPASEASRLETSGSGSGRLETLLVDSGVPVPAGAWSGRTATADSAGRKVVMFSVALRPS